MSTSRETEKKASRTRAGGESRAYARVPNLNLFPDELKRKRLTALGRRSLYLLVVAAVGLAILMNREQSLQDQGNSLRAELQTIRSQITTQQQAKAEADELEAEKERLQRAAADYAVLADFARWAGFLDQVSHEAAASGVVLTTIKQKAGGATLNGSSPSPSEAVEFYRAVGDVEGVSSADIVSLAKASGETRFSYAVDVMFEGEGKE